MSQVTEQERNERILKSREFIKWTEDDFLSDQDLKRQQPPLVKEAMTEHPFALPRNFEDLPLEKDFIKIVKNRRSNRVYTGGEVSLLALSFLLWSTQGIKDIRGKNYATLRTVASGGARHPFETYLYVRKVEGLTEGLYHYLPMTHELELLKDTSEDRQATDELASLSLCEQKWATRASVIFYYSVIPYRAEWRYAYDAHRVMMMDAGHVTENLYLSCSALGLGTCAIAAVDWRESRKLFGIGDDEEYIFYSAPVGTINTKNEEEEQAFYAFLKEDEE